MPTPAPTPTPAGVSISPIEVAAGATEQHQAIFKDEQGNTTGEAEVAWTVLDANAGSITAPGLFSAGEVAGRFENAVEARASGGQLVATTAVRIVPGPLEQVGIAPDRVEIGMEMTQQFVAVGADRFGNRIPGLKFSWTFEADGGAIDADGLFTSGSKPGIFANRVKVTTAHGNIIRSAATGVTVLPDRIAFISLRAGDRVDLYVMNIDGTNQRLVAGGIGFQRVSWSPDGRRIAYAVEEGIFIIDDDAVWNIKITGGGAADPSWSPDGTKVAYGTSTGIHVMDIDGGNQTRLTRFNYSDSQPSWSPDGKRLVLVSDPDRIGSGFLGGLFIIDSDGSNRYEVPNTDYRKFLHANPDWSPASNQIIYQSGETTSPIPSIWVVKQVSDRGGGSDVQAGNAPSWSIDGDRIAFHSFKDADPNLSDSILGAEIYVCVPSTCSFRFKLVSRLTNNSYFDGVPSWAPRKRGVEVSSASVVSDGASSLNELPLADVTAKARKAVVRIETDLGSGSGFIIDSDGLILTNNHVILDAKKITVFFEDGTEYTGKIRGRDMIRDLALVEIEAKDLHTLELGDVSRVQLGSDAVVVGYPLGLTGLTVTRGSAASVKYDAGRNIIFVQTDSTVNPGSSGGPLLNMQGEAIGVIVSKIVGEAIDRVGFAISANTVKLYLDRLKAGEVIMN